MSLIAIRRFIFLVLAAGTILQAAPTQTVEDRTLHDRSFHLSVTRPESWHFQTIPEKRAARTAVEYKNTRWGMMVRQQSVLPAIVISKYAEPYAGLNPAVTIERYPLEEARFKDAVWVANAIITGHRRLLFTPYESTAPQWTVLDARDAAYYKARYELEVVKLPTMKINQQIWVVATPLAALVIETTGPQSGPDVSTQEIAEIIRSIRFDK